MSEKKLRIGELARLVQVSQDTLRFCEKHGLLTPGLRSQAGYRLYPQADLERVGFILSAKRVGFTLNEIHDLLGLEVTKDDKSCEDVKRFVDEKLDNLNQRIGEMQRIQKTYKTLSDVCCGGAEPATHCTILEALNAHSEDGLQHSGAR